jgi:hypothetical protein
MPSHVRSRQKRQGGRSGLPAGNGARDPAHSEPTVPGCEKNFKDFYGYRTRSETKFTGRGGQI